MAKWYGYFKIFNGPSPIWSLLIENASKATFQGSDKKKNCKLKNVKESREALSLSEKSDAFYDWPTLLKLLYIWDLRFSWKEILGKFSLLDYLKNSFIDIVCIVTALFWSRDWKKPQFALNRKRIEMRLHIFINVPTLDYFLADSHETRKIVTSWDVLSKDICSRVWPTLDRLMFLK